MSDVRADPELPRGVALAWGVAAHPQRGPKRELSIERIVEAAIDIADAEGLAAVSMSRVAASLGFTTMSLYRYVTSKDDLILLMQEGASLPPVPDDTIERTLARRHHRVGARDARRVPCAPLARRHPDLGCTDHARTACSWSTGSSARYANSLSATARRCRRCCS